MYRSSSSLCKITRARSDRRCRSCCSPLTRSGVCLSAQGCQRLLQPYHQPPPADGRPLASPHISQKIHKFKQGREGEKKRREKKSHDHFRAVQIGGSAGCRSNQLMQLSRRPPADHLPGSRDAVVAVSAGLAPRRGGPAAGREPSARPRAVPAAGPAREPARCPTAHACVWLTTARARWPKWAAVLYFLQGIYLLSFTSLQTGCVFGASLCLRVFGVYLVCTQRCWEILCPLERLGTLRNR